MQNYEEYPRIKIAIGYDGHWSDFQRSPNLSPAEFDLTNLEIAVIDTGNGFAAEMAFDIDDFSLLFLDDPDPETGITWWRSIISIQGEGAPLVVWPDGDFNGNVNYLTHGSTGWDHFGWWDVSSESDNEVVYRQDAPVNHWEIH